MRNRKHDIEQYLKGELSPAEMHALEKEALNDPFLAEALEGIEHAGRDNFLFDLHKLNRSVRERTRKRHAKSVTMWKWPTGIAATILLIAVSGFLVVTLMREQHASRQSAHKAVVPADSTHKNADSLTVGSGLIADAESPRDQSKAPQQELLALKNAEEEQTHAADAVAETPTISEDPKIAEEQTIATEKLQAEQHEPAPALSKKADDGEIVRKSEARAKSGGVPTGAVHRSMVLDSILIKGRVLSAEDGEGLPGVNVIVKGTSSGTVTDATGNYELPVPARNTSLVFSFLGFKSEEVRVTGQAELDVALDEDVSSLSEVIVTGRGDRSQAEGSYSAPEPQTGKSDFKTYLESTIVYPAQAIRSKTEGKVTVRFTVEPSGQLTGFEILKGIGSGCDEELIRVIKEGPAWKPAKRGERAIAEKVKVRHKFELPR